MLNALTVDVEDYYQVSAFESVIRFDDWAQHESRVERNTHRVLNLLDEHSTKGTFFILGWVAERHPTLVRTIHERGHEVASHGYSHRLIYTQTPEQFREETRRCKQILEEFIGHPVRGYRAASYSITARSLWALDILWEEGFVYDSSIFPVYHDRYGIANYPRFCHVMDGHSGSGMIEFPLSTVKLFGWNVPIAGGGYFRLYPYGFTRWGIGQLNRKDSQPAVVYLHPWELDPQQPRIAGSFLSRFRHYRNLEKTERRLKWLLCDFQFTSMYEVLKESGLVGAPGREGPVPAQCLSDCDPKPVHFDRGLLP